MSDPSIQPFLRLLPCRGHSLIGSITPQIFCGARHSVLSLSAAAITASPSNKSMIAVFKVMVVVAEHQAFHSQVLVSPCPVCSSSTLLISSFDGLPPQDVKISASHPHADAVSTLSHAAGGFRHSAGKGIDLRLICQGNTECRIALSIEWPADTLSTPSPFVRITQKLTTPAASAIGISLVFHNPSACAAELEVIRYISWFARPLSSSLSVALNGVPVEPASVIFREKRSSTRHSSFALEWRSLGVDAFNVTVPANSTILMYATMERSYAHWQRHQPDAHRGLDLPPLFVWHNSSLVVVDSPIVLVPLPDFSMPYVCRLLAPEISRIPVLLNALHFNLLSPSSFAHAGTT